jgi:hypothetical protein
MFERQQSLRGAGAYVRERGRYRLNGSRQPSSLHADLVDGALRFDEYQRPELPIWASIYTTNQGAKFGAQFITFNVAGNLKKARGYFKDISGTVIDSFTITAD